MKTFSSKLLSAKTILLLLSLFLTATSFAQKGKTLTGKVTNDILYSISDGTVKIKGTGQGLPN